MTMKIEKWIYKWHKVLIGVAIHAIFFTTLFTIAILSLKKSSPFPYCSFISNNATDGWRNEVKISPARINKSDIEYKGKYRVFLREWI